MISLHTLHILNKTPEHPRFKECLSMLGSDDALLLTENGVVALEGAHNLKAARLYALSSDACARGLGKNPGEAHYVDYTEMVALTLQAQRVISW